MSKQMIDRKYENIEDDDLRGSLMRQRYLRKDAEGRVVETPGRLSARVAMAIAASETRYGATPAQVRATARRFCRMMRKGEFLPNSPTLMNAGRPNGLLSACFVLEIPDSIEGIFETVKRTAMIQKDGGGIGFALDTLRPTGDLVASSGGRTSGPISFWRVLAETTKAIQQGAHRRGANMAMMSVDHPDILKFITAKQDPDAFDNFNISVKIPDAFMHALQSSPDSPHVVTNPRTGERYLLPRSLDIRAYGIQDLLPEGTTGQRVYTARDVWQLIVGSAHATGEPGVCFIDQVNRDNPTPAAGRIGATNPCGEQPLLSDEACNLGSIDVAKFVRPDGAGLRWKALGATVRSAVRFLDNVIDVNYYPESATRRITLGNRKIGLGIMGFADALVLLDLRYDSDPAVRFAGKLAHFLRHAAHHASQCLAEARESFANWPGSVWDTQYKRPMRNASCTTIAPTGSISILAGCSGGIEPIYSLAYRRRALDGREFIQLHPLLARLGQRDGWLSNEVKQKLIAGEPITEITEVPGELAKALVTAHEVAPQWHVRTQAAFQEHVDSAVSKTVNLRSDAVVSDVDKIFRLAFDLGCKGITVYRDGSRAGQVFSTSATAESGQDASASPRPRSRVTSGKTSKFRMGCGTLFVTVNRDEHGLCEVFANLGKAGGCPSQSEATCRVVSAALRSGVAPEHLIEQLHGIRCLSTACARHKEGGVDVLSCPDAIAKALGEGSDRSPAPEASGEEIGRLCPDCGHLLHRESGCFVCPCGYSKCG